MPGSMPYSRAQHVLGAEAVEDEVVDVGRALAVRGGRAGGDLGHLGGGAVGVVDVAGRAVPPLVGGGVPGGRGEHHERDAVQHGVRHRDAARQPRRQEAQERHAHERDRQRAQHREAAAEPDVEAAEDLLVVEAAEHPDAGDHRGRGVAAAAHGDGEKVDGEREGERAGQRRDQLGEGRLGEVAVEQRQHRGGGEEERVQRIDPAAGVAPGRSGGVAPPGPVWRPWASALLPLSRPPPRQARGDKHIPAHRASGAAER